MTRLPWALLGIALPLGLTLACGSGEDRPRGGSGGRGESGGTTGEDAGSGGSPSTGGKGSGGSGNSSGAGGTGGAIPIDIRAPTFEGATGVDVSGAEDRVRVLWSAATDDVSPEKRIAYRVYRATEPGAQDFARGRRCGEADPSVSPIEAAKLPCFVTSGAGATNALVRDVLPAHPYFFVARAVDEAGNEDENVNEVSAQTDDTTSPEFGGVRSVNVASATSLRVTWGPGYDVASSDAELRFNVYAAAGKDPDPGKDTPVHESGPGEHEAVVTGLDPLTAYRVIVRAVDPTGNEDANERILGATTPEGLPPTFDGASRALEQGFSDNKKARVRVFWPTATDNVTDSANILYDVYQATRRRGEDFSRPSYTSLPGAASILITGLEPGTRYYYVVRARDVGGNQDTNIKEIEVITPPLDQTPPTFTGISAATSTTPTSVDLTWSRANDNVSTQQGALTYLVYLSETTPVDVSGTPHLVVSGALSATVGGLAPGKAYHFTARARDGAGNLGAATPERTATTMAADAGDTVAPDFAGGAVQAVLNTSAPTTMNLSWTAATDAGGAANIRYHVCASMTQTDCEGTDFFRHVVLTTGYNALSATPAFLTVRTDYFFLVRAEDKAGNVSASAPFVRRATPTSFLINVRPILSSRCGACHDFSYVSALEAPTQINWACPTAPIEDGCPLILIEPGKPEFSAIYRKVNPPNLKTSPFSASVPNEYGGLQEPRDTPDKLTGAEDDALRTWIAQGATAN